MPIHNFISTGTEDIGKVHIYTGASYDPISKAYYFDGAEYLPIYSAEQYVYKQGDEFKDLTGGWVTSGGGATRGETYLLLNKSGTNLNYYGTWKTTNNIDLTNINTIRINVTEYTQGTSRRVFHYLGIIDASKTHMGAYAGNAVAYIRITDIGTWDLDVSNIEGAYAIHVMLNMYTEGNSYAGKLKFDTIELL